MGYFAWYLESLIKQFVKTADEKKELRRIRKAIKYFQSEGNKISLTKGKNYQKTVEREITRLTGDRNNILSQVWGRRYWAVVGK